MGLLTSVFGSPELAKKLTDDVRQRDERVHTIRFGEIPVLNSTLTRVDEELRAMYLRGLVTNEDAIDAVKEQGVGFYQTMLKTDTHLASLDRKLRSKVANTEFQILPADQDDAKAKEIADFVTEVLFSFDLTQSLRGIAHAASRGFSVSEIVYCPHVWKGQKRMGIERIYRIRENQFTIAVNRQVRLITQNDPTYGSPITTKGGKHVILFFEDGPWGDGLLNYVYPSWYLKRNSLIAFSRFQERWGNPPLTAEYTGTSADPILEQLEKLYSEAIAALPPNTNLKVLQPDRDYDFIPGLNYFDDQQSRLYTGGDLSTGHAGGRGNMGATESHAQTEDELVESIAKSVFLALNQQVIIPLVNINFGIQEKYPYASLGIPETDSPDQFISRVSMMFEKGVSIQLSKQQIYEVGGFTPPKDPGDTITPSGPMSLLGFGAPPAPAATLAATPAAGPVAGADPATVPSKQTDQQLQVTPDLVLNGAQVTAATAIVSQVATRQISRDAGIGQLVVLFNLQPEQAEKVMGSVGKSFFADAPTPPAGGGATQNFQEGPVIVSSSPTPKTQTDTRLLTNKSQSSAEKRLLELRHSMQSTPGD